MAGLRIKKYLSISKRRFDPISVAGSIGILLFVVMNIYDGGSTASIWDVRSFLLVFGGAFGVVLFQFDFMSIAQAFVHLGKSLMGTPDRKLLHVIKQLDQAILGELNLLSLRDGQEITGELLNDIVYMHKSGLLFEEIDEFVNARVSSEYFSRQVGVQILQKFALAGPALGLFGTVLGLVGVLKGLSSPAQMGPSMSLALLTTVYGTAINSLFIGPLAGRLEHHNQVFIEIHEQLLNKVGILLARDERTLAPAGNDEKGEQAA